MRGTDVMGAQNRRGYSLASW